MFLDIKRRLDASATWKTIQGAWRCGRNANN